MLHSGTQITHQCNINVKNIITLVLQSIRYGWQSFSQQSVRKRNNYAYAIHNTNLYTIWAYDTEKKMIEKIEKWS